MIEVWIFRVSIAVLVVALLVSLFCDIHRMKLYYRRCLRRYEKHKQREQRIVVKRRMGVGYVDRTPGTIDIRRAAWTHDRSMRAIRWRHMYRITKVQEMLAREIGRER